MDAQFVLRWSLRASLVWLPAGLAMTLLMPQLLVDWPIPELVHVVIPAVTASLIVANLFGSLLILARTGQALRALAATLVQLPLFSLLFFQIAHHVGPEHFYFDRQPRLQDWLMFTGTHALRAADLFDFLEAYDLRFQSIRHATPLTAGCLVAFHLVIDLFLLRCLVTWMLRGSKHADGLQRGIPGQVAKLGGGLMWTVLYVLLFGGWFGWWFGSNWLLVAFLSDISMNGRVYLLGAACLLVVGWELFGQGNNRWTWISWARRQGRRALLGLVVLQLFLMFGLPVLWTREEVGFLRWVTGCAFAWWCVSLMCEWVGITHFGWNYHYPSSGKTFLAVVGWLFPLLLAVEAYGSSAWWNYVGTLDDENLSYLVGAGFRFVVLAAMLPLVEQISSRLSGGTMSVLRRRWDHRRWNEHAANPLPFRQQPWAIPVGWVALFVLLAPVWWWTATSYTHWRAQDMFWWPIDNLLRVFDFLDLMQIYDWHLAVTPRDVWLGTLTFGCRVLMGLSLMGLFGSLVRWVSLRCLGGFGMTEVDLRHYQAGAKSEWGARLAQKRLALIESHPVSDQQVMHTLGVAMLVVGVAFGLVVVCQEKGWPDWGARSIQLAEVASHGTPTQRDAALRELRLLGPYAEPAVAHLRCEGDRKTYVRVLGAIGGPQARKVLTSMLAPDQDHYTALVAIDALGRCGRCAVPELVAALEHPDGEVRDRVKHHLWRIGRDAVPCLMASGSTSAYHLAHAVDPYCTSDQPDEAADWGYPQGQYAVRTPTPEQAQQVADAHRQAQVEAERIDAERRRDEEDAIAAEEVRRQTESARLREAEDVRAREAEAARAREAEEARRKAEAGAALLREWEEYKRLLTQVTEAYATAESQLPKNSPGSAAAKMPGLEPYLKRLWGESINGMPHTAENLDALGKWAVWFEKHEDLAKSLAALQRKLEQDKAQGLIQVPGSQALIQEASNAVWNSTVKADVAAALSFRLRTSMR